MERPSTAQTVYDLAVAAEEAGFSVEQLLQFLIAGVGVEALCQLIELRLGDVESSAGSSSRWIM
jgi:hypothetical protein